MMLKLMWRLGDGVHGIATYGHSFEGQWTIGHGTRKKLFWATQNHRLNVWTQAGGITTKKIDSSSSEFT